MRKSTVILLAGSLLAAGILGIAWWQREPPARAIPGVLLSVGPAAKTDPYAVAQGAVTNGEPVLIDFGDGDFAFFVNQSDDVDTLINGCGDRVTPTQYQRFPLLVDARFRARNIPPYLVEGPSARYVFDLHASPDPASCR